MHVDAGDLHARQLGGAGIDRRARRLIGMPNLFSALPVAILAWVFGVDVGIDPDRDMARGGPCRRDRRTAARAPASDSTLTQRMPSSTASASSRAVLPMPENMILSGGMPAARARRSSPSETTSAPAPRRRQRRDHRLVGIRLHGVADQRRHVGEGAGEHAVVPLERRGGIAIEWRADRVGERDEIDRPRREARRPIVEVMHRELAASGLSGSKLAIGAAGVKARRCRIPPYTPCGKRQASRPPNR